MSIQRNTSTAMKIAVTFRIGPEMKARIDKACDRDRNPYAPSKTRLLERGIELALKEIERKKLGHG